MLNEEFDTGPGGELPPGPIVSDSEGQALHDLDDATDYNESIFEELSSLIDDAGLYASAEIAFQKTRAKLGGRLFGAAVGYVSVALVLLHIALIAMAVGLVIALAPLVTIWGAIAIVVGLMLLGVAILLNLALKRGRILRTMFSSKHNSELSQ